MAIPTNYKTALHHKIFGIISKASQELNVDSYVIGGFVRDLLLNRGTKKDIDVVAVGSGIELALKVSELLPKKPKVQVFKTYGTAMLRFEDTDIEFVGARKESYNFESRYRYRRQPHQCLFLYLCLKANLSQNHQLRSCLR